MTRLRSNDITLNDHLEKVESTWDAVEILNLPQTELGFKQGQRYNFALHEIRLLLMEREKLIRGIYVLGFGHVILILGNLIYILSR